MIDLLVIGAHPDDAELGMGATIALHVARGDTVVMADLSRGELASNGTPAERETEARAAAAVLGVHGRENLGLPDRDLNAGGEGLSRLVKLLRRHRPRVVAAPYWQDRHPDHGVCSRLVDEAVLSAGLSRYGADQPVWRVEKTVYYFINSAMEPSFVIDVTDHYETKQKALLCHRSQFVPDAGRAATRLNRGDAGGVLRLVKSRDNYFGALAGVLYAEGFVVRQTLTRRDLSVW